MNEYNKRILQNVLQDHREENDIEFLKEIEEAANDPMYQNPEGAAEAFAEKYSKSSKKRTKTFLFRAAAIILVITMGMSLIPITVKGTKGTLVQLIANFVNSEFISIGNDEKDKLLLSFEGQYVPTWIPDGYTISSVFNLSERKEITFTNANGKKIIYNEHSSDSQIRIDSNEYNSVENIEINGYKAVYAKTDEFQRVAITTDTVVVYITCEDATIDLIGFAELIEKR
ncbi:MAG: DUF4367 domain-containing protein [Clostridia bacterium]|nr:DUF4367 domain-containing protein [Clostridia bacterium]